MLVIWQSIVGGTLAPILTILLCGAAALAFVLWLGRDTAAPSEDFGADRDNPH
jgi:hypothetical protein